VLLKLYQEGIGANVYPAVFEIPSTVKTNAAENYNPNRNYLIV
jgi:hypothetical protein